MIRSCPQTTLRSLFISAMAVSALLPASEGPIQASPVNANPALESLRATASSWGASEARAIPAPPATPQSAASTITPPSITPENLKRLLALIAAQPQTATLPTTVTTFLGLTQGDEKITLRSVGITIEGVRHSFAKNQKDGTDDCLLVVRAQGRARIYLTNTKLVLRSVCEVPDNGAPLALDKTKYAADFEKELKIINDAVTETPGNA